MIVAPYKGKAPRHEVGFVLPSGRVVLEDGSRRRIGDLPSNAHANQTPGLRLYADHHTVVSRFAMRGVGELDMFNRSWFAWWPDPDHRVLLLKDDPGNDDGVLAGLVGVRDFLAARGASAGSVGHMSRSLLRATLTEPLGTGVGALGPKAIMPDNMGGRQESYFAAGRFESFQHVDLVAAYARTMGDMFYDPGGVWVEMTRPVIPDTPTPVIVQARVRFPAGLGVGPLGRRLRRELDDDESRDWPVQGELTGTYLLDELRGAIEAGCDVRPLRVWVRDFRQGHPARPFAAWWRAVQRARALPGYAGHLGKMIGAALWGTFIGNGDQYRVHYDEARPVTWRKIRGRSGDLRHVGYDLAEIVTAKVRARLYRELIAPAHAAGRLIGVHTDGGLLIDHPPMPRLGRDWPVKYAGRMDYITPACYRYKVGDEARYTYVMAGVPDDQQAAAFTDRWRIVRGVIAQGYAGSLAIREREAVKVLVAEFGPGVFG